MENIQEQVKHFRSELDEIRNERLALLSDVEKGVLDVTSFGAQEAVLHCRSVDILTKFKNLISEVSEEESK